jgi:lipopolysaccharide transport system permease protein
VPLATAPNERGHAANLTTSRVVLRIRPAEGWRAPDLEEIWIYRELLYSLIWRDLRVRYKQTLIGIGWVVVQPLLTMVLFTVFFGRLAKMPSDGLPHPIFYYGGLASWLYFANALLGATNSIVDNRRLITKVYFPRLMLPMASVLSAVIDFGIAVLMFAILMVFYSLPFGRMLPWGPIFFGLTVTTAVGGGLWLAALNGLYRDVRYAIPFLLQVWMFASPVAYPSSLVPERWRWFYALNPMGAAVDGLRWSLTGHGRAPDLTLAASMAVAMLLVASGAVFFRTVEDTLADRA